MNEADLEEGIGMSLINRRFSTGDLFQKQSSSADGVEKSRPSVAQTKDSSNSSSTGSSNERLKQKRHIFSRMKSLSYDEESLSRIVHEQLAMNNISPNNSINHQMTTPVIVKTEHPNETVESADSAGPNATVIPKQVEGLLQVSSTLTTYHHPKTQW